MPQISQIDQARPVPVSGVSRVKIPCFRFASMVQPAVIRALPTSRVTGGGCSGRADGSAMSTSHTAHPLQSSQERERAGTAGCHTRGIEGGSVSSTPTSTQVGITMNLLEVEEASTVYRVQQSKQRASQSVSVHTCQRVEAWAPPVPHRPGIPSTRTRMARQPDGQTGR